MIYLDHAATTPVKDCVLDAMLPYFSKHFANASSGYQAARESRRAIEAARAQVAELIGAQPNEVYFTSGGSESDNWALTGVYEAHAQNKQRIVSSAFEHHAVLNTCLALAQKGADVVYLPVSSQGLVRCEEAEKAITKATALVSVMMANNEVGSIQPIREIAEIAHRQGALMHTDAVQAAGHIEVDVNALGVDLLSLSAHKFYGPKGIGALYIRKGTRINRFVYGGEQEKGLRAGTENIAAIVGMGAAATEAKKTLCAQQSRISALRDYMIDRLQHLPNARVNALEAPRLPGHVHITLASEDTSLLLMQLDMRGIAASSGSACASGVSQRSHMIEAMGIAGDAQADLRFTLGDQTTKEEIDRTIDALMSIVSK